VWNVSEERHRPWHWECGRTLATARWRWHGHSYRVPAGGIWLSAFSLPSCCGRHGVATPGKTLKNGQRHADVLAAWVSLTMALVANDAYWRLWRLALWPVGFRRLRLAQHDVTVSAVYSLPSSRLSLVKQTTERALLWLAVLRGQRRPAGNVCGALLWFGGMPVWCCWCPRREQAGRLLVGRMAFWFSMAWRRSCGTVGSHLPGGASLCERTAVPLRRAYATFV